MGLWRSFLVAIQFLTILPVDPHMDVDGQVLARSMWAFPVVGLVVGGLDLLLYMALYRLLPAGVLAAILFVTPIVVTGGLHLDGLADTADGIFSGRPKERMLEIMRDSRVGSFGVLALVSYGLLRWSALSAGIAMGHADIAQRLAAGLWLLVVPPVVARVAPVAAALTCEYARKGDGLGRPYTDYVNKGHLVSAICVCGALIAGCALGTGSLITAIAGIAGALMAGFCANTHVVRKLGGVTGDTLGAILVLSELGALLAIVSVLRH